jgi:hypothetical protein
VGHDTIQYTISRPGVDTDADTDADAYADTYAHTDVECIINSGCISCRNAASGNGAADNTVTHTVAYTHTDSDTVRARQVYLQCGAGCSRTHQI